MKNFTLSALVAGAMLVGFRPVNAQPPSPADYNWFHAPITPPTQALPLDKAMAAVARAASINTFVDATALPKGLTVRPYAERVKGSSEGVPNGRIEVIGYTAGQAGLICTSIPFNTFVFWREPDANRVINLVVAHQKQLDAEYPPTDETATLTALGKFLRAQNQAAPLAVEVVDETLLNTKDAPFAASFVNLSPEVQVPFATLPMELQKPVQAEFLHQLRAEDEVTSLRWFELSSWKDARLRFAGGGIQSYMAKGRPYVKLIPLVQVFLPGEQITFEVGTPHDLNPTQVDPPNVSLPAYLNEGEHLSQFQTEEVPPTSLPGASPVMPELLDLSAQTDLQHQVKFSTSRVALRSFVADLAKQGQVALSVAPDVAPDAQVIASSSGMKLSEAMGALEHLYFAHWTKSARGYELQSSGVDELSRSISQISEGNVGGVHYRYDPLSEVATGAHVADEVEETFTADQLKAPDGVPFTGLPPAVQSHILQLFRDRNARQLFGIEERVDNGMSQSDKFVLRYGRLEDNAPHFFKPTPLRVLMVSGFSSCLGAYSPDGRFITRLFPDLSSRLPTPQDIAMRKQRRFFEQESQKNLAKQRQTEQQEPNP